jgi:hypothetical protein
MNTAPYTLPYSSAPAQPMGWLSRTEAWLDARGRWAWIAAMVLGFIFVWPVGLALLAYLIWSKRMFSTSCRTRSMARQGFSVMQSSGNIAFDNYKAETLRRLEEEQHSFEAFLQRLREAKDKAEFDDFMADRARAASAPRDDQADQRAEA